MGSPLRHVLPLVAASLALSLGPSTAEAQCPDFDGDGMPDGTGCESGPGVTVSPPAPVGPPPEPPPPEQPPPEPPPPGQPGPEGPAPEAPGPSVWDPGPSGGASPGGGGAVQEDPAIAAQRAAEAMEARAAWDRAAANVRALRERGAALDEERRAFRRMFEDARRRSRRVADELVRVPVTGTASATPTGGWRGNPPPARGRRLAGPPPPPLGQDQFVPVSQPWPEPAPIVGLFDPAQLLQAARDRILGETKEWLTEQARDVIERNVPGVRRLREAYERVQQYAELGRDLSDQNEATVEAVFRAGGEVARCMAGRPCDEAFVRSLAEERGEAHHRTATGWIRELTGEANEDDDDDGDGDDGGAEEEASP